MVKCECKLTWADGAEVIASIETEAASERGAVVYTGAVERLPERWERTTGPGLMALFRDLARETGAELSVRQMGEWPDEADVS